MEKQLFEEIIEWQDKTSPKSLAIGKTMYLWKETQELLDALVHKADVKEVEDEIADCFMLLAGIAAKLGYSYEELQQIIQNKFDIVQTREWQEPTENGEYYHVKLK